MSIQFEPLGKNVLAQKVEVSKTTKSGIIVPESSQDKSKIATVLEIGNEVKQVKVGDKILYKGFNIMEIKLKNANECFIVSEEDILTKIKE